MKQKEFLYGSLLKASLKYKNSEKLFLNIDNIEIEFDTKLLGITDKSEIALLHDFYIKNHKTVWGIRKIEYSEENKDDYFVIYRHVEPHVDLPDSFKKNWEAVKIKGHPYNEVPYNKNGRTNISFIHPKHISNNGDVLYDNQYIFTIYFAKEGNINEEEILAGMNILKDEIQIY